MKTIYLVTLFTVIMLLFSGCVSEENTINTRTTTMEDTPTASNEKTLTVGENLNVGNGMEIRVQSVDSGIIPKQSEAIPKQVFISIIKDGNTLDATILKNGENYNYGNILDFKVEGIYSTDTSDGVTLTNIVYRQDGDAPLKTSKVLTVGETLELGNGFTVSIDEIYRDSPRKALITLSESGVKKDEKTVAPGELYNYDNRVSMSIDKIFAGPTIDVITIDITK
jgi:hypothetical protein